MGIAVPCRASDEGEGGGTSEDLLSRKGPRRASKPGLKTQLEYCIDFRAVSAVTEGAWGPIWGAAGAPTGCPYVLMPYKCQLEAVNACLGPCPELQAWQMAVIGPSHLPKISLFTDGVRR